MGVRALARALTKPAYWIGHNAGVDGAVVVHHIGELPNGQGYNAATGEYGDLIGAGVIDPVKVTHSAVVNAASVARLLLTTEVSVVDKPGKSRGPRLRALVRGHVPLLEDAPSGRRSVGVFVFIAELHPRTTPERFATLSPRRARPAAEDLRTLRLAHAPQMP